MTQRELKFRFWDEEGKRWLSDNNDYVLYIDSDGKVLLAYHFATDLTYVQVTPVQYTGLHDKNGKEIYEGDIIDYGYKKSVIVWQGSTASFISAGITEVCCEPEYANKSPYHVLVEGGNPVEIDSIICTYNMPEIIGNIYEHSHLLTPSIPAK